MSLEMIKDRLPESAKDIKLNLSSLLNITNLSIEQLYGTLYASALASQSKELAEAIIAEGQQHVDGKVFEAAVGANSLMAMNNVYYRFLHSVSDDEYSKMPPQLRMNFMSNPGVDKVDFEMFATAISAINGCAYCMDSHVKILRKKNVDKAQIQNIIRIAAIIKATAVSL